MEKQSRTFNVICICILSIAAAVFLFPIFIVLINSFKAKFSISQTPFVLPDSSNFVGLENYITGTTRTDLLPAIGWSLFVTVFSVAAIVVFTSMTAWYIVRSKSRFCNVLYYVFVLSMIVPFQMVMFTMSKIANILSLDTPWGLVIIYLGFGAGLSVFLFVGFIKSVPRGIEEAATIDGCSPLQTFFLIVFPILKPTTVTVAILNTMWIWNDYLLPYLVIGSDYKTLPIAVQYLKGGYGSVDMGALMAVLILSIIPIVVFYLTSQKYIIRGVAAGAIKG